MACLFALILLCLCGAGGIGQAWAATITSTVTGGNLSSGASWVGGVAPVAGDTIVVANGATVVVDTTITLGSKAGAVGAAVTVNGTSSSSFGTLTVNSGVVLTLRGFDTTTNVCMLVNRYARFTPSPGATIELDVASDGASLILNKGVITAVGTSGSKIAWRSPTGNRNWNTSASFSTGSQSVNYYDIDANIIAYPIGDPTNNTPWISNSSGTALGSFGDSSLVLSAVSPSGILATEVATLAAVNGTGKYYVDYALGVVYWYQASGSTFAFTQTYKRLTFFGATISSVQNTANNEGVFDYCTFDCLGEIVNADDYLLFFNNKQSDTQSGSLSRKAQVTNSIFTYCRRPLGIKNCVGTSGDMIRFDGNQFNYYGGDNAGYGWCVGVFRSASSYVSIQNNVFRGYNDTLHTQASSAISQTGWLIRGNVFQTSQPLYSNGPTQTWPDSTFDRNFIFGFGAAGDTRGVVYFGGTSGHEAVYQDNVMWRIMRGINYQSYEQIKNSVFGHCYHHVINGGVTDNNAYFTNITVSGNLFLKTVNSGFVEIGYNRSQWIDNLTITHNTMAQSTAGSDASSTGAFSWADSYDNAGPNLGTKIIASSNLIAGNYNNVKRGGDTAAWMSRLHISAADYNNVQGNTGGADYGGYNRFATFTHSTGDYNTSATKNLLGVALFDPLYSTAQSGKSLVFTYTSATDNTLAWDGGTAVQLVLDSGTATAGAAATITNTGKTYPTTQNSSTTPIGCWIKITSGTGVGQIRRITGCTATVLTVTPAWTTTPASGSTYSIYKSEVQLFDSGATNYVRAGIDLRDLPVTTLTDTGIGIALHSLSAAPAFVDSTRNLAAWSTNQGGAGTEADAASRLFASPGLGYSSLLPYIRAGFAPTNTALKNAGHDGGDIGAFSVLSSSILFRRGYSGSRPGSRSAQ